MTPFSPSCTECITWKLSSKHGLYRAPCVWAGSTGGLDWSFRETGRKGERNMDTMPRSHSFLPQKCEWTWQMGWASKGQGSCAELTDSETESHQTECSSRITWEYIVKEQELEWWSQSTAVIRAGKTVSSFRSLEWRGKWKSKKRWGGVVWWSPETLEQVGGVMS